MPSYSTIKTAKIVARNLYRKEITILLTSMSFLWIAWANRKSFPTPALRTYSRSLGMYLETFLHAITFLVCFSLQVPKYLFATWCFIPHNKHLTWLHSLALELSSDGDQGFMIHPCTHLFQTSKFTSLIFWGILSVYKCCFISRTLFF